MTFKSHTRSVQGSAQGRKGAAPVFVDRMYMHVRVCACVQVLCKRVCACKVCDTGVCIVHVCVSEHTYVLCGHCECTGMWVCVLCVQMCILFVHCACDCTHVCLCVVCVYIRVHAHCA